MSDNNNDSQPLSSPSQFFAVSWGAQRGVFNSYREAQAAMKGFPSPVYKKFKSHNDAEEFVKRSQPESSSIEVTEADQKCYAVARGKVVGIFKDLETAKEHVKGFPNAMHKKFDTLGEAKLYLEKYYEGKVEEKKSTTMPKKSRSTNKGEEDDKTTVENPTKSVARKRTYDIKMDEGSDEGAKMDKAGASAEVNGEEETSATVEGKKSDAEEEEADGGGGPGKQAKLEEHAEQEQP